MKNFFLVACVVLGVNLYAQKGSYYVGGHVGFNSSNTKTGSVETEKSNFWTFSPEFGTFLTDNIQLGLGLNVGGGEITNSLMKQVTKQSTYGGTLYSRYFFGAGSNAFRPFAGVNVSILPGTGETKINGTTTSEYDLMTISPNLNAGFAYALSKKVTAVGSLGVLGFSSSTIKPSNGGTKTTTNNFGFDMNSLGNRFTIGVYLTL